MNVFPRKNLARLTTAGAVDTGFIADTDSDVFALALQNDGRILAGGKFTQVNGDSAHLSGPVKPGWFSGCEL